MMIHIYILSHTLELMLLAAAVVVRCCCCYDGILDMISSTVSKFQEIQGERERENEFLRIHFERN